jgi:CRP-like cAMP-binding protein
MADPRQQLAGLASPLIAKLETRAPLSEDDRDSLLELYDDCREVRARRNLIREGERPDHVIVMIEGWAARYKLLPDGARQITAFLIPGDFCDLHVTILSEMDHGITTLTRSRIALVPRARIDALTERTSLTKAIWWAT